MPPATTPGDNTLRDTARLAAGAVMISFSAVFVKLASVGPIASGFYRTCIGGLILAGLALARREGLWRSRQSTAWAALAGVLFALDLTFWHQSILLVGPGLATILANFQVFFLALTGALFLKEKVGIRLAIACGLAMVGLYLLVGLHQGMPARDYGWGVVLGLLTAVCYTGYILSLRRLMSLTIRPSALGVMAVVSLVTALIMGGEALALGESLAVPALRDWLALGAYGIAGQVLGWVLISQGLPGVPASRAGLILLMQPTLAFIWDIIIFNRPTDAVAVTGAALALAGIYLGMRREGHRPARLASGERDC